MVEEILAIILWGSIIPNVVYGKTLRGCQCLMAPFPVGVRLIWQDGAVTGVFPSFLLSFKHGAGSSPAADII